MTSLKKATPQAVSAPPGQAFDRTQRCGPTSTGGFVVRNGLGRNEESDQWNCLLVWVEGETE